MINGYSVKMHTLQPKHIKLKKEEANKLLLRLNISLVQLPKISKKDPALPETCEAGDVVRIERQAPEGLQEYFRVVV